MWVLIFVIALVYESLWALWTVTVAKGRPWASGGLALVLVYLSIFMITEYLRDPVLLHSIALGTALGSFGTVYLTRRFGGHQR